jgi:carbon-monoxide dehydrogenase iron sulfur subunit
MKISIDPQKCKGCLYCELACSFHHANEFLPDKSSIKIGFDNDYGLSVAILNTCDLCSEEEIPLCMEFCPVKAVKITKAKG